MCQREKIHRFGTVLELDCWRPWGKALHWTLMAHPTCILIVHWIITVP